MAKINFARIDAKEYPVVTLGDWGYYGRTIEEERLRMDLTLEYLQGVSQLQADLRERYGPMLDEVRDVAVDVVREYHDERWSAEREAWDEVGHLYYT